VYPEKRDVNDENAMLRTITAAGRADNRLNISARPKRMERRPEGIQPVRGCRKPAREGRALDKWKAAFPTSDFAEEREEQF
jgi:hypothetical protein